MPKKKKAKKALPKKSKDKPKINNFDDLKAHLEKSFGKIIEAAKPVQRISTFIPSLDYLLGSGLPLGRIVEFFGEEGGGKSLLATQMMAAAQYAKLPCALIDMERSFDPIFAKDLGLSLNHDKFLKVCPVHAQQAFEVLYTIPELYKVIVVDSVAALIPQEEMEAASLSWGFSKQPLIMATGLRKLVSIAAAHGSTIIFVNQLRDAFQRFTQDESPGGRALKFYSTFRLRISAIGGKSGSVMLGNERVGHMVKLHVAKTKCSGHEHEEADIPIIYKRNDFYSIGVDRIYDLVYLAIRLGVLNAHSHKFGQNETKIGQNREQALANLRSDMDLMRQLRDAVYDKVKER